MGLGLAGCVTPGVIDERLKAWVGRDADELATVWGAPNGSYLKKDGGKILSYERTSVVTTGASLEPDTFSRYCRVDFTIDPQNKVASATWRGAAAQCDHVIPSSDEGRP